MSMKPKAHVNHLGVQDLCRKLKDQLDQLQDIIVDPALSDDEKDRRKELLEKLQGQLKELSL